MSSCLKAEVMVDFLLLFEKLANSDRQVKLHILPCGNKTTLTIFSMPSFEHCPWCNLAAHPLTLFCGPDSLYKILPSATLAPEGR